MDTTKRRRSATIAELRAAILIGASDVRGVAVADLVADLARRHRSFVEACETELSQAREALGTSKVLSAWEFESTTAAIMRGLNPELQDGDEELTREEIDEYRAEILKLSGWKGDFVDYAAVLYDMFGGRRSRATAQRLAQILENDGGEGLEHYLRFVIPRRASSHKTGRFYVSAERPRSERGPGRPSRIPPWTRDLPGLIAKGVLETKGNQYRLAECLLAGVPPSRALVVLELDTKQLNSAYNGLKRRLLRQGASARPFRQRKSC